MANSYSGKQNIFRLDTAGSTLLKAALADDLPGTIAVKGIEWTGATTAGHGCIIQDEDNVVLFDSVASGANYRESTLIERRWTGDFKITTLGSGRVYIIVGAVRPGRDY